MQMFQHSFLSTFLLILFSTASWAKDKVVVVPLGSSLEPGTALEGTTNKPILTLINNGTGNALYGRSNNNNPTIGGLNEGNGIGVSGVSTTGIGVYGYGGESEGVGIAGFKRDHSISDLDAGYFKPAGLFSGDNGVVGITKTYTGLGVFGWNKTPVSNTGWAGYFVSDNGNGVYITTSGGKQGLSVVGGSKNAIVATDEGARLMYSEESTEVWFTDYGFGQTESGLAVVTFDPLFSQTVNLNMEYHVFLQPYGDATLFVTNRSSTGFEVHSSGGNTSVEFSYRVVALRLDYENQRMEPATWADNDPNLYPEKKGTAMVQRQATRE